MGLIIMDLLVGHLRSPIRCVERDRLGPAQAPARPDDGRIRRVANSRTGKTRACLTAIKKRRQKN